MKYIHFVVAGLAKEWSVKHALVAIYLRTSSPAFLLPEALDEHFLTLPTRARRHH